MARASVFTLTGLRPERRCRGIIALPGGPRCRSGISRAIPQGEAWAAYTAGLRSVRFIHAVARSSQKTAPATDRAGCARQPASGDFRCCCLQSVSAAVTCAIRGGGHQGYSAHVLRRAREIPGRVGATTPPKRRSPVARPPGVTRSNIGALRRSPGDNRRGVEMS